MSTNSNKTYNINNPMSVEHFIVHHIEQEITEEESLAIENILTAVKETVDENTYVAILRYVSSQYCFVHNYDGNCPIHDM
jgi:hypothetical protein